MLKQLEVFSQRVASSIYGPFPAGTVETDPIQITNITGLGPVNADVNTKRFGSIDGEFYTDSSVPKRNIVMTAKLNPDWSTMTIEDLRKILYIYFMPKSRVRMRFASTQMPDVHIVGYVESCDPNIFSKDPEFQISIICPSPYFVEIEPTVVTGISGVIGSTVSQAITYDGTEDTGFVLYLEKGTGADLASQQVQIYNKSPDQESMIVNSVSIDADKYLDLSTVSGSMYAHRAFVSDPGNPVNWMGRVTPNSAWMNLKPGVNNFRILSATGGNVWTMRYYNKYGGL